MDAAGIQARIKRFKELIDGISREMGLAQSDHAILDREYPNYLGALLKARQGCEAAKEALEAASDRLDGKPPRDPWWSRA